MALDRRELNEPSRAPWVVPVILSAAAIAVGVWSLTRDDALPAGPRLDLPSASASAPSPPPAPRCTEISTEPFVVGDLPPPPPKAEGTSSGGPAPDPQAEPEDPSAPFAVEIGRGAVFGGGFAAGVRRDAEGGAIAAVATLGPDGRGGRLVRLGRSRGDLDPPVVAGAGDSVLTVLVEPNAGGRALKVAKVSAGGGVTWGPELSEGRDESLAVDVAASGPRAAVVWDDLTGAGPSARSSIMLSTFDVATMKTVAPARPVSSQSADASAPHITARPGGYWLGYLVRGEEQTKKKASKRSDDVDESDDQGEEITTSWVEVVPLDEAAVPAGPARAVSPKKGHALSFDLELAENGSVLVAWRDDDTPTGSSGGKVSAELVRIGGGGEPRVLLESAGSAGAPDLLPGWISLASVNGPTRIGALGPTGELIDDLAAEPSLGAGEPIAATSDAILWARPVGRAVRLAVVRCRPRPRDEGSSAGDGGIHSEAPR